jgi:hypothetical protein
VYKMRIILFIMYSVSQCVGNVISNYDILFLILYSARFCFEEAVKGTAVASNWGSDITKKAESAFGSNVSPEGIVFDKRFPLILVLPVRFANLKAVDVNAVRTYLLSNLFRNHIGLTSIALLF